MPPRNWELRLLDMIEAGERIVRFTTEVTSEAFADDEMRSHAVRHNFGIIGEAARAMPAWLTERYPEVAWRAAGDMRNFVIHVYWRIDDREVWDAARFDVPELLDQLRRIRDLEASSDQST